MIYLVLNLEDPNEPFVVNICTTLEAAKKLMKKYQNNAKENGFDLDLRIETLELSKEVIWDCYNNTYCTVYD